MTEENKNPTDPLAVIPEIVIPKRYLSPEDQGFHKKKLKHLHNFAYLSVSKLKCLSESERHFYFRYILGIKPEDTKTKIFGRLIHKALLEPEEFLRRYTVMPAFSGKGMKDRKAAWMEEQEIDALFMEQKDADKILYMIESVQGNSMAQDILKNANTEVHGYYKDETLDAWFYVIVDILKSNVCADLKSTKSAKPDFFGKDILDYGYYIQAAVYLDAVNAIYNLGLDTFPLIVVENCEPYTTLVMDIPEYLIVMGRQFKNTYTKRFQKLIESYSKDPDNTCFLAYDGLKEYAEPKIPGWLLAKLESKIETHTGF